MGGLPRRATFIEREAKDGVPTILLESGGFAAAQILVGADLANAESKGKLVIRALADMGYRAVAIAEEDLYLGKENLGRAIAEAGGKIAFLSANVVDAKGGPVFAPSVVINAGGARVGVIGLTSSELDPGFLAQRYPGVSVADPVGAARREVEALRGKCDLVVALTHLGYGADRALAGKVPGLDIIVGGRSSTWLNPPVVIDGVLICNGYFEGRAVGKLLLAAVPRRGGWVEGRELDFSTAQLAEARKRAVPPVPPEAIAELERKNGALRGGDRFDGSLVDMDASIPDHPAVTAMIDAWRRDSAAKAEKAAARVTRPEEAPVHYTGSAMCRDCHLARVLFWERTAHKRAYSTLTPRTATGDPDCLPCHTTGYLQPTGYAPATPRPYLRGVQCEACHGVGSLHGTLPESYQLIRTPPASVCRTCHTASRDPGFDYAKARPLVCGEASRPR